jgi:hypothetical protein
VPAKACFHARRSRARAARGPKARPWLQGRGRRERRRYRDDHCGQEISPIASPASAKPASCSAACTHFCSGEEHARPCQVHRTGAVTREPIPKNEAWPQTYEDLQPVPVLSVGQLTTAFDDDLVTHEERQHARLYLHLRAPSASGTWRWGQVCGVIELPEAVVSRLSQGAMPQAPTLREIRTDDGSRLAVLDLILEVPATVCVTRPRFFPLLNIWGIGND